MPWSAHLHAPGIATCIIVLVAGYLIGSTPGAYVITRAFRGIDITTSGSGNAGALNVLHVTESKTAFALTVLIDVLKGLLPVLGGLCAASVWIAQPLSMLWKINESGVSALLAPEVAYAQCALAGAVLGHNYSLWMALIKHRFAPTGQGMATGAGALLAYDWRYLVALLCVALIASVITRHVRIGQVGAAVALPVTALALGSPDWLFALFMGIIAYAAAHRRFIALLRTRKSRSDHPENSLQ